MEKQAVKTHFKRYVIATSNRHKFDEIAQILHQAQFVGELHFGGRFLVRSPEETGANFVENAYIKAVKYARAAQMPAIADDSGLCIDFLNGEPGLHSARFNQQVKTFGRTGGIEAILELMAGVPHEKRGAHFFCAAVFLEDPDSYHVCTGKLEGFIAESPRGQGGFGYDPIFLFNESQTLAQVSNEIKNSFSHRAHAFNKLASFIGLQSRLSDK